MYNNNRNLIAIDINANDSIYELINNKNKQETNQKNKNIYIMY